MNAPLENAAFAAFLLFCRIGGCIMFAPGLSSARIPVQVRVLVAFGVTLSLVPLLHQAIALAVAEASPSMRPLMVVRETVTGSMIGIMARMFVLALQFAANVVASVIGLAGIPGVPLDEAETGSPLATLASTSAVMVLLAMGLHIEMLRAVIESYGVFPVDGKAQVLAMLSNIVDVMSETSFLALRLSAPFIAYGVAVNIAIGMANRFTPHISVYHTTTGGVMIGGFLLLYLVIADWMAIFSSFYETWLSRGGF